MSLRFKCVQTIQKILEEKVFFNTLKSDFHVQDSAFANKLILTALRRKCAIDKLFSSMLAKKIPSKNKVLNYVLLLGATEILYMDTPDYAVLNEYVNIAKKLTDRFSSSMVNAVLRKITLHKDDMQNAVLLDEGFKQILKQDYSKEQIALIEQMLLYEAPLDITPKEKPDLWAKQIGGTLFENGTIRINSKADISSLKGYEQGAWWVQDLAASLPVCLLGSIKGKKVLDLCAAPGGKTAQLLAKGAVVTALDISAERLETLKENINRLQLSENLTVLCADGFEYLESCKDLFDIILLDAPCSATGTFRKHPEVIHFKTLDDVRMQIPVQQKLLDAAATHITENGTILYCTCSIAKAEGEEQIKHFLKKHPDFCLSPLLFENLKICDGKILDKNIIDKQVLRTLPYNMKDFGGLDSFFAAALVYKK